MTHPTDNARAELIAGLRQLADWYEQHPDAPPPNYPQISYPILGRDDVAGPAAVERFAAIAGVPVERTHQRIEANLVFGSLELHVYYHGRDVMAEYNARQRIAAAATPEELAANGYRPPVDPSPAAAAAEVPADLAPIETPGLHYADETPQPMTGAEALDAAATPEEFAGVLNAIFDSAAVLARDAENDEDGAR